MGDELVPRSYRAAKSILIYLDALIAIIIIVTLLSSEALFASSFGKAALSFGFVMMGIVTVLKVLDKI